MRQNACRLALVAALAATLLAPPAGGCTLIPHTPYQRHFDGPLPAADGGAWFSLVQDDGSAVALRLGDDGEVAEEVVLRADGLRLEDELHVDAEGRFWSAATRPSEEEPFSPWRLAVFDAAGRLLADDEMHGEQLLGVADGVASVFASAPGDDGQGEGRGDGQRAGVAFEIWHQDPLSGHVALAFERTLPGEGHRSTVLADDGAIWLLLDSAVPGPGDAPTLVLRRLSPTGAELAAWRLVGGNFEPYSLRLHPGRDGTVLLAGTAAGAAGVWVLDGDGISAAHRFAGASRFDRAAPEAAGGFLLRQGDHVLHLDEAGAVGGRFAVAALASWATWEGEARGRAVALLADSTGPATPQLVEALAHAHGADAERAMGRLLAAGPRAVDLLVAWRASHPSSGAGPGRRFRNDGGYGALADHLVDELMSADPDGFGQQVTSLLPTLDADLRERLVLPLIHGWPRPSAGFVALMEEWLTGGDDELASFGSAAFVSTFEEDGDGPPRFPVSRQVFDHFLAELARLDENNLAGHDRFFFPRFPEVAVALDAVLADPEHPARPAVVAWLGKLPHDLPTRRSARFGEAGPEPDLAVMRPLQRWAERWATADDPELAAAAGFVARAAGAVVAAADGGEETVAERVLAGPEPFLGWWRQAIGALYGRAPDDVRARLFARLAEPGLAPGARRAVADQFRHAALGPEIDQEVVAAVATLPGLLDDLRGESDGALLVDFVAFLWQRLEGRPALRRQLEAVYRDGCAAEAVAVERSVRDYDQPGAYFPTSCLRRSVESDVGRRVPAPLLAEHVALYRRPEGFARSNPWLPTLVEVEAKLGPLPGLAETIRRELLGAPEAKVDAEALAAALGSDLPAAFAEVAAMPVLDLVP